MSLLAPRKVTFNLIKMSLLATYISICTATLGEGDKVRIYGLRVTDKTGPQLARAKLLNNKVGTVVKKKKSGAWRVRFDFYFPCIGKNCKQLRACCYKCNGVQKMNSTLFKENNMITLEEEKRLEEERIKAEEKRKREEAAEKKERKAKEV